MAEEWRPVRGYESLYEVSSEGFVRSLTRKVGAKDGGLRLVHGRVLSPASDKRGYPCVSLWRDNEAATRPVHRLVADAFVPNERKMPCVNHLNTTPLDNRAVNLEWCTHQENMQHSSRFGNARATKNPNRAKKLTAERVADLRARRAAGASYVKIGREFGITRETARLICLHRLWA